MGLFGKWFSPGTSKRKQAAVAAIEQQRDAENAEFRAAIEKTVGADKQAAADKAAVDEEELLKRMRGRQATILTGGLGDSSYGQNVKKAVLLGQAGVPGA